MGRVSTSVLWLRETRKTLGTHANRMCEHPLTTSGNRSKKRTHHSNFQLLNCLNKTGNPGWLAASPIVNDSGKKRMDPRCQRCDWLIEANGTKRSGRKGINELWFHSICQVMCFFADRSQTNYDGKTTCCRSSLWGWFVLICGSFWVELLAACQLLAIYPGIKEANQIVFLESIHWIAWSCFNRFWSVSSISWQELSILSVFVLQIIFRSTEKCLWISQGNDLLFTCIASWKWSGQMIHLGASAVINFLRIYQLIYLAWKSTLLH